MSSGESVWRFASHWLGQISEPYSVTFRFCVTWCRCYGVLCNLSSGLFQLLHLLWLEVAKLANQT